MTSSTRFGVFRAQSAHEPSPLAGPAQAQEGTGQDAGPRQQRSPNGSPRPPDTCTGGKTGSHGGCTDMHDTPADTRRTLRRTGRQPMDDEHDEPPAGGGEAAPGERRAAGRTGPSAQPRDTDGSPRIPAQAGVGRGRDQPPGPTTRAALRYSVLASSRTKPSSIATATAWLRVVTPIFR
jgi:hypothetical protein